MKLNDMAIDPEKLEHGAWVSDIPDMGELRLKVRGIGNNDFRKLQTKLVEAEPRQFKTGGRVSPERQDAITAKCLIHTILIDWSGLVGENNEPIPYSKELATELLTSPKYRRFRDAVSYAASIVAEDRTADDEEAAKNSETPSSGT